MARREAAGAADAAGAAGAAGALRFHWLRLRATAHATEDPDRVAEALRFVAGLPPEEFAPLVRRLALDAHHGGEVVVLEALLSRSRDVRGCLARALSAAPPATLLPQVEARTDDDGVFYLRVEKQAAFQGRLEATAGEDAVQVRLKPQVHPARREKAVAALQAWLVQAAAGAGADGTAGADGAAGVDGAAGTVGMGGMDDPEAP